MIRTNKAIPLLRLKIKDGTSYYDCFANILSFSFFDMNEITHLYTFVIRVSYGNYRVKWITMYWGGQVFMN